MSIPAKPAAVYGRESEWAALQEFVANPVPVPLLALVSGRRRQGKTYLLQALVAASGGFYWQARQQSTAQNLRALAAALSEYLRSNIPFHLANWEEAVAALVGLGRGSLLPVPVVIDEVGYLIDGDSALPSRLQAALTPFRAGEEPQPTRLILCGSALGQMRRLLDADAPLRGRASLDLVVRPFGYRDAASFWGVDGNLDAAFRLDALLGGTPAYRTLAAGDAPTDGDIDGWVCRRLLVSSSPLYREGRLVISEDPTLGDVPLYWGLLGAIAEGAASRGAIAAALGRPPTSLHHALGVLADAGWIAIDHDPLRAKSSRFRLDDPIVRFYRLVVEPNEPRLGGGRDPRSIWDDVAGLVSVQIYAQHLEQLARSWVLQFASERTTNGPAMAVGPSQLLGEQVDLLALTPSRSGGKQVGLIGEVKAGSRVVGRAELDRLDRLAQSLHAGLAPVRLLVARSGFTADLKRIARQRSDVQLVDLTRLYRGD